MARRPGPEPMNTGHSQGAASLCSGIPGSRAAPAPRNDECFGYRQTRESGNPVPVADHLDTRFHRGDDYPLRLIVARGLNGTAVDRDHLTHTSSARNMPPMTKRY